MTEPTKQEIDRAISDLALRELDKMPVGSTVMISAAIGYKKMSFWWNVRCWGFWRTIITYWRMAGKRTGTAEKK